MIDQAFATLEYGSLLALIETHAQTPMGRQRVQSLTPLQDPDDLQRALDLVSEAVALRQRGISFRFSEINDPEPALARLRVEDATLDAFSILQIARLCEQALAARSLIHDERDHCPVLWQTVAALPTDLKSLVSQVTNKILPNGEIDDRASPELARIRHDIFRLRSQITRTLEGLMRKYGEAIQDPLVTVRNERFVIPVKADHRGRIEGVAHGFSSSGATIFLEPMQTIDANNEMQSLKEAEEREIAKVLFELSEALRRNLPFIEMAGQAIEELDFINAKTAFHETFECVIPQVHADGEDTEVLEFIEARHPLLAENLRHTGKLVVPVSFSLDKQKMAMVISGANAGGKTVVLKTAGLLSLMALSGLPVPAQLARVPFYQMVLADIGDHQSLAANLSTFTAHVANISRMMTLCQSPALVLLDEVGTGTDPEEGSALGVAVVDHFRRVCGAHVIATTHYRGLKMYAANDPAVLNASVEFDERTLQPTYRLIVGVAGSSSGLEIARRFGIPQQVINSASENVDHSSRQATEYLRQIKTDAEQVAALRVALEEERAAVAEKFASLDREAERRERQRQASFEEMLRRTTDDFDRQARQLLSQLTDRAERLKLEREAHKRAADLKRQTQRALQAAAGDNTAAASRRVRVVRGGRIIEQTEPVTTQSTSETREEPHNYKTVSEARPIAVGDRVRLKSFGSIGIVDQVRDDEAEVRVKALRFREKLNNLELVEEIPQLKPPTGKFEELRTSSGTELNLKTENAEAGSEINVIGQTTDQAVNTVDKFLDEASLASLSEVRIVHGHGTGALRRAIGELLQSHPHVLRFAAAPPDKGGAGATVVELRH